MIVGHSVVTRAGIRFDYSRWSALVEWTLSGCGRLFFSCLT